jgi:hypothetical protein
MHWRNAMIKLLVLSDDQILITQIEEVGSEMGEPDCKLTNPFVVKDGNLEPWLFEVTNQNVFMIHSDKIITITDPKPSLLEKYEQLTK